MALLFVWRLFFVFMRSSAFIMSYLDLIWTSWEVTGTHIKSFGAVVYPKLTRNCDFKFILFTPKKIGVVRMRFVILNSDLCMTIWDVLTLLYLCVLVSIVLLWYFHILLGKSAMVVYCVFSETLGGKNYPLSNFPALCACALVWLGTFFAWYP